MNARDIKIQGEHRHAIEIDGTKWELRGANWHFVGIFRFMAILILLSIPAFAQNAVPAHLFGGGISYDTTSTPAFMGELFYASQITAGTYSYTSVDVLKVNFKPVGVQTQTETGIAQFVRSIGKVDMFVTAQAGAAATGSGSLGGSFSGGYLLATKIHGDWYALAFGKFIHSTVGATPVNSGDTIMVGLNVAWGK